VAIGVGTGKVLGVRRIVAQTCLKKKLQKCDLQKKALNMILGGIF